MGQFLVMLSTTMLSVTGKSVETYKEVQPDDFIISLRSFQGDIEFSEYHGVCSPAYVILRKRTELSEVFFKYLFKSHRFIQQLTKNLEGLRDGKMISYRQFSELLLPNPTFDEQQKIADCLASIDELLTFEAQKLNALKTHKKGLMQQLFPARGETVPKLRFPEFQNVGEWEEKTLGEIVEVASGQVDPTVPPYCDMPHIGGENIESHTGNLQSVKTARELGLISGKYFFNRRRCSLLEDSSCVEQSGYPRFRGDL